MKIDFHLPEVEISPFGIENQRSEDGFLKVRIYLLFLVIERFDWSSSLLEFWYSEEAIADDWNEVNYYEVHVLWTRWRIPISRKKVDKLRAMYNEDSEDV